MILLLLCLNKCATICPQTIKGDKREYLNEQNYDAKIANGASFVAFGAPWCRDCAAAKPFVEKLAGEIGDKVNFYAVDFDKEEGLKDKLNIRRIPTIIFYKDGKEVGTRLVEPS